MKIFIAFMLLFCMNCLAPVAISATVNVKTTVAHSVILPVKKLSFQEKLYMKLSGKVTKEDTQKDNFAFPIILMILGLILIFIGDAAARAAKPTGFIPSTDGIAQIFLGSIVFSIGGFISMTKIIRRLNRK